MQEFLNWTVETIREDKLISPWLEEKKFEWTPLVSKNIHKLLEKNHSVIIITDSDRKWFLEYIINNINSKKLGRPSLPFYNIESFMNNFDKVKSDDDIAEIRDMFNISFPQGYSFWYIGRSQDPRATIPKVSKNSFLWLFDEQSTDAFNLSSSDEALDMKLLQMFRLYNKTISAVLFAETSVHN